MQTITIGRNGHKAEVPVVTAFRRGRPATVVGGVTVAECDHRDATWSSCVDVKCPTCGAPMFMPRRFLAGLDEATIAQMHEAWVRAGWPHLENGAWVKGPGWVMYQHPLFEELGGIPVRPDRIAIFEGRSA